MRNLLVVWLLTGLWHGASWNFILWGFYYFILLFIEKLFLNKLFEKIPGVFARIYLCAAVLVGWVFFYHTDLSQAIQFIGIMFGAGHAALSSPELSIHFWNNAVYMVVAFIGCTPLFSWLFEKIKAHAGEGKTALIMDKILKPVFNLCVLILSIIFLVGQSYSPFLYFKF